jgi:predicted RNase H-like HicB family nuclease
MKKDFETKNIVWKEGNAYVSLCLDFGISSFGTTKKQALSNLQEAIELYIEDNSHIKERIKVGKPEYVKTRIRYA